MLLCTIIEGAVITTIAFVLLCTFLLPTFFLFSSALLSPIEGATRNETFYTLALLLIHTKTTLK
jgi:TM2 domain-containing membrane protein YozV